MAVCKFYRVCLNKCTDDCKDYKEESYTAEAEDIWYERNVNPFNKSSMTIQELADAHVDHPEELDGGSTITAQRESYKHGALRVLKEVELTISVSEEGYLESNLKKLIKELKGEL